VQTVNLVSAGAAFVGLISNIGKVETTGIEVDGTFLVTENFLLTGSFAIIDAEMKETPDPVDDTIDISGLRPPGAPEWTYNLMAEYTFNLSGGSTLQFRGDVRGRSDVYNQTSSRTGPRADYRLRPEVQDFGARVTWVNADQNLSVALWGKNLAEDWDITNFGPPTPCCSSFAAGFRGKTEYGLTATVDF
jgi:iron complex outermembrane receptor protein